MRRFVFASIVALTLALAACGGDEEEPWMQYCTAASRKAAMCGVPCADDTNATHYQGYVCCDRPDPGYVVGIGVHIEACVLAAPCDELVDALRKGIENRFVTCLANLPY